MQSTSATWRRLWAAGNALLQTRAIIAGTEHRQMSSPVVSRALTQGGLSVGNAVSATCRFSILPDAAIPRAAKVVLEQRLCRADAWETAPAGEGGAVEPARRTAAAARAGRPGQGETPPIPAFSHDGGGIAIDTRGGDADHIPVVTFSEGGLAIVAEGGGIDRIPSVAYVSGGIEFAVDRTDASEWLPAGTFYVSRRTRDAVTGVLTLECYDALLKANAVWEPGDGAWPRAMADVAAELAGLLGVTVDGRTEIPTGGLYAVDRPAAGETIHDILGQIGQACGGNWIITPANRLRLVPVARSPEDAIRVEGVTRSIGLGVGGAISGVRDRWRDETYLAGTEDGIVLDVSLAPTLAAELAEALVGTTYQPFSLEGAVYDPAAELGDAVRAGANGEIDGVLFSETATLGLAFRGDIAAPEAEELSDEYPYIGASERALSLAKAYAREAAADAASDLDAALTQEEVFNRLTDGGEAQGLILLDGKLYVNATYINAGELNAALVRVRNLTVEDISSGLIHSADYETVSVPMVHPAGDIHPTPGLYPSNGELATSGFAIDFETGQIYGGFYSRHISELQGAVSGLQADVLELRRAVFPESRAASELSASEARGTAGTLTDTEEGR